MKLSVIIPSYKDPCLHKTIQSILDNFVTEYEIIPVIDGYALDRLIDDPRVKPVFLKENVGMRDAINEGVAMSEGKYIMRTDEHCIFDYAFDQKILETIEDNWIVTARRYFLDPVKWEVMRDEGYVDYEKLIIRQNPTKFTSCKWKSRTKERADIMLDETMAMQGSMWVMPRSWWDKVIVRLESQGYGTHYQDSTEMIFKTWLSDGKLMLNKNTWYAHKHRSFNRTHQYPHSLGQVSWDYALKMWKPHYERIRQAWAI